ncbi:unnamed protein product, partial [Owenia fusiformis]
GRLHSLVFRKKWENLFIDYQGNDPNIMNWLCNGVDISEYFVHFKGSFKGKAYDSDTPPRNFLRNAESCIPFVDFIAKTLEDKIKTGAIKLLGRLGECQMPHVAMPLLVEPSKPRLCHDDRYINLWMRDMPFTLEKLREVPRMVDRGAVLFSCDDKSGYDHVLLSESSQMYFGIVFGEWVMVYRTIPSGWKLSPYVYHQSLGMVVTSYLRSLQICTMQYVDDRPFVVNRKPSEVEEEFEFRQRCTIYAIFEDIVRSWLYISYTKV